MPAYTARTSVRASGVPAVPPKTPGTRAGVSAATTPMAAYAPAADRRRIERRLTRPRLGAA